MSDKDELSARVEISIPDFTMARYAEFRDILRELLPGVVELVKYRLSDIELSPVSHLDEVELGVEISRNFGTALELARYQLQEKQGE